MRIESEVEKMPKFPNEYDFDEETPKPYTAEQRAAIDEMNAEIEKAFREFCEV